MLFLEIHKYRIYFLLEHSLLGFHLNTAIPANKRTPRE